MRSTTVQRNQSEPACNISDYINYAQNMFRSFENIQKTCHRFGGPKYATGCECGRQPSIYPRHVSQLWPRLHVRRGVALVHGVAPTIGHVRPRIAAVQFNGAECRTCRTGTCHWADIVRRSRQRGVLARRGCRGGSDAIETSGR